MYLVYHIKLLQSQIEPSGLLARLVLMAGVIIVAFAFSFLLFFIYSRQKQNRLVIEQRVMKADFEKQLLHSRIEIQESTLSILSKELHDNVGQLISSCKMLLRVIGRNDEHSPGALISADETLTKAVAELRTLAKSYDKDWLVQFDFIENLSAEVARVSAAKEIDLTLNYAITVSLPQNKQIILFRIVQEAIQNAIRHAEASTINVAIAQEGTSLQILIEDNGKGFEIGKDIKAGMGIMNINTRSRILGGSAVWQSVLNGGTKLIISIPI